MRLLARAENCLFVAAGNAVLKADTASGAVTILQVPADKCVGSDVLTLGLDEEQTHIYVGFSCKTLACFEMSSCKFVGCTTLRKRPAGVVAGSFPATALDRSADPEQLRTMVVVADNAGDIYALDAPNLRQMAYVTGHTATVLTDLELCVPSLGAGAGLRLVASADRDEKVRVSRFPDLETIQCFCLGHTSVVASVSFVRLGGAGGRDLLLSSGWDHKICLWDPLSGELLHSVVCAEGAEAEEAEVAVEEIAEEAGEASASVEAAADAAGEGAAEGEGEGEGDADEEKKQYDEGSAGHYPHRVLGVTVGAEVLVAVIFKGLPLMKIYKCTQAQSSSGAGLALEELQTQSLHAPAVDVVCIPGSATSAPQLAVLLPKPHGLQLLDLSLSGALTLSAVSGTFVAALVAAADSLGFDFALPAGSAGADQPTGMKKHTLDKRFNSAENIDCRIKRGSKRSKKKR
ncbi:hypothetical protein B484DRAFT_88151 [Ochromonadaceae sp. CCMP2298]|nr:hypothetical protein B484DRAFT_88151 [Ochromonadaceae sp. CCMP2298]|mmetsp:Transcript_33610/g.74078  ORF Transcript_33610/g.74078 Transcript_33610/m.74078 type:complete len:460 (-) Transcript_33610:147-1526(-)